MASFATNEGASRFAGGLDWTSASVIAARLVASSASPNKDDTAMTGFTPIGTDQTLVQGNRVKTKDPTNDQVKLRYTTTLTWTAVAGGSTVGWIAIYVEDAAADATRVPLFWIDVTDTATNGGNLTYTGPTVNGDTNVIGYTTQ
jgi:hypothetical protein